MDEVMSFIAFVCILLGCAVIGMIPGHFMGWCSANEKWEDKMIEMGYAYYDSTTAEFTMKEVEE